MTNNILPDNYEVPQKSGNYMKFKDGPNKFRILASPIMGWEGWKTQPDGGKKPVRIPLGESMIMDNVDDEGAVKHFWAMPVYNYDAERIQILEITQKGIQKSLRAMERSKDWGSLLGYDILVTKSGEKLDTEYQVSPIPPKPLDKGITQLYKDTQIDLEALYRGEDPFADSLVEEADKAIG